MPVIQTNSAWDVLLDLERPGHGPLHDRVTRALRDAIRDGRIGPGSALPPSRGLAADLGISRWTVTEAYGQLVAEGYLEARTGSATRVRWSRDPVPTGQRAAPLRPEAVRFDMAPGLPDLRAFPRRRWADAIRTEATTIAYAELGYPQPDGHPRLRRLLAEYLRRSRGATATADDVTLCTGVADGARRICHALLASGIDAIGCEDPGWTRLRDVAHDAGMTVVPIAADNGGLSVDALAGHPGLRAVLATPAHQFPRGAVLTATRRAALLRWARETDGIVLEDDYDAEFRYDRRPVGTLQGMDPERVILLKSLSKTLSPALHIGWMVAPPRWTEAVRGEVPPTLDQLAFATLLETGAYDRHLRACRRRYRARRDALVRALAAHLPGAVVEGAAAGLHLILRLPFSDVPPGAVVAAADRRGVRVADLASYHATADPTDRGLVLGYGNLADNAVDEAVRRLSAAVHDTMR